MRKIKKVYLSLAVFLLICVSGMLLKAWIVDGKTLTQGSAAGSLAVKTKDVEIKEGTKKVSNKNYIDNGYLKIYADKNYDWSVSLTDVEENNDGSYTASWNSMNVGTPVTISEETYETLDVGSKLPEVDDLAYKWGDFHCVKVEGTKKFFIDSTYDDIEKAREDGFLILCFDKAQSDDAGNVCLCEESEEEPNEFCPKYTWLEINVPFKTTIARDATIKYIKSIDDETSSIQYETVPFKEFMNGNYQSDFGAFNERNDYDVDHYWHETGQLKVHGNETGEIIYIEESNIIG